MAELKLTPAQQAVIENRGGAILVSAAAGSGKTFVLVKRLLGMINDVADPADVTDFLIITYTKAAAAELRAKINDEIRSQLGDNPYNRHLQKQLTLVHGAKIMTVHSFCTSILRENAHLAEISPDFRVAEESECELIRSRALEDVLESRYAAIDGDLDFALLVETMSAGVDDKKLCEVIFDAYDKVRTHADPQKWMDSHIERLKSGTDDLFLSPWEKEIIESCRSSLDYWISAYEQAVEIISSYPEMAEKYLETFQNDLEQIKSFRRASDMGWDEFIKASHIKFQTLKQLRGFADTGVKDRVKKIRDNFKNRTLKKLKAKLDVTKEDIRKDIDVQLPVVRGLFSVLADFENAYSREKLRRGALDFGDLEHLCIKLLTDDNGEPTETARSISGKFREIMVDEYQDTNEIQDRLISAVSRDGQNLFMVGDVKQSIYRFRLADPTIFLDKYKRFKGYEDAEAGEPRKIILSQNFRSRKEILDGANFVFRNIMSTEFGEMEYGKDEMLYLGASYPESDSCNIELDLIDMEENEDEELGRVEAEANFAAKRIKRLLAEQKVYDSATGGLRALEPKDIVILMRSPGSRADAYISALEAQGIPGGFGGGKSGLLDTVEAKLLIALLEVIDNPMQDIPLISVLKSPLFGFTADELAEIRIADRKSGFYEALTKNAETSDKSRAFLQTLNGLRSTSSRYSSDELIWRIFENTDIIPVCLAMVNGELRKKNLMLLYEYAKGFETGGYRGLFGFVTRIRKMREQGENMQGASETSDGNAVTIMSIHKSKGLEFPVVLLCDLSRQFNTTDLRNRVLMHKELGAGTMIRDTGRMIEYSSIIRSACELRLRREMLAEELRVLYVAMTRPKENLIMTASFKKAQSELEKCLVDVTSPVEPQLLLSANCPAKWLLYTVLNKPEGRQLLGYDIGAEKPKDAWTVNIVKASSAESEATEQEKAEVVSATPRFSLSQRFSTAYPHQQAVGLPSKLTATFLKGRYLDDEASDSGQNILQKSKRSFKRPSFVSGEGLTATEKGTAAHLVMQYIDFAACTDLDAVKYQIKEMERAQIITSQQAESVNADAIWSFFDNPLGRRIKTAAGLRREFKFSVLTPAERFIQGGGCDELLLQGVIDCCFENETGLTLVDFKTDKVSPGGEAKRAESYRVQLEVYAYALERITKKPVTEKTLYFFATGQTVSL